MKHGPVRSGLEISLKELENDGRLYPESAALVAAARAAASRIDEAPPTDNVSLSVFFKYLEALDLHDQISGIPNAKRMKRTPGWLPPEEDAIFGI